MEILFASKIFNVLFVDNQFRVGGKRVHVVPPLVLVQDNFAVKDMHDRVIVVHLVDIGRHRVGNADPLAELPGAI